MSEKCNACNIDEDYKELLECPICSEGYWCRACLTKHKKRHRKREE